MLWRLSQLYTTVSRRERRGRGLAEIMRDSRFEPEAAGDGPHLVGTQTVRSHSGDVEMEKCPTACA